MKVKVTEKGVMIPPEWLLDVEEVEITQENDLIVVKKVPPIDPILDLETNPVTIESTSDNKDPREPGLLTGKLGDAFFEPLPDEELKQWE